MAIVLDFHIPHYVFGFPRACFGLAISTALCGRGSEHQSSSSPLPTLSLRASSERRKSVAMRNTLSTLVVSALFVCTATAADLSGVWTLTRNFMGNPDSIDCNFTQSNARLTVTCDGGPESTGEVNGRRIAFEVKTGPQGQFVTKFAGELDANETTMKGTWHVVDLDGNDLNGEFAATKK
jgi:hypothetical protein